MSENPVANRAGRTASHAEPQRRRGPPRALCVSASLRETIFFRIRPPHLAYLHSAHIFPVQRKTVFPARKPRRPARAPRPPPRGPRARARRPPPPLQTHPFPIHRRDPGLMLFSLDDRQR